MDKDINKKNEIVAVLNNLRLKHVQVYMKDQNSETFMNGFITKADNNYISLFFEKVPDLMPLKNITINFEYNRSFYTSSDTSLRLFNMSVKNIEFSAPEILKYHPLRKFTRVSLPPESLKLYIAKIESKAGDAIPGKATNIDELPPNLKKMYMELMADEPDLKMVLSMISDELKRYSSRFKTNIFKDMEGLSPLEKVVFAYKKTFWISDTDNLNNYVHLGDKYGIIGYEKYFELVKKPISPDILEQIRANYLNRGIISYCMVPILIGERVVGVIEVSVSDEGNYKNMTIYDIYYIKGLADILAEVYVKSKTADMSDDSSFSVQDISMGGILASTKNIYLTRSIGENSVVKLKLVMDGKEIMLDSRVVRYDYIPGQNAGLNVAFEFLTITNEDKAEIGNFIRKYLKMGPEAEKKDK